MTGWKKSWGARIMNHEQARFGALGLCRKAGRLVMGFDAVCEDGYNGRVALVLTAADLSPKTLARLQRACEGAAEVLPMPLTQQQLCPISKKPVGVYGVADENLARLCREHLAK